MTPFRFILMTLNAARLTRLVVKDQWPPTKRFREWVEERNGEEGGWTILFTCPWCWGVYTCAAFFLVDHFIWTYPTWLLAMGAAMEVVGLLGTWDSRD